ncbi:MAG: hypothetical protein PWP52_1512 [Bacteroidales bacterium]|nr:hypothetical protein [Bacteroidales bacterium]
MKNKYFKMTKTITLAILFAGIANISFATDFKNQNFNNICLECFEVDQETERKEKLSQIEGWMINDEFWKIENTTGNFILELEVDPNDEYSVIEDWMIDDNFWIYEENNDEIEPWMIDPNFWQI